MNGPRHPQDILRQLAERAGATEDEILDLQDEMYFSLLGIALEMVPTPPPIDVLERACSLANGEEAQ
jgi:hypothetical protein